MPDRDIDDELFVKLAAYGADLARWPAEAGAAARRALLASPRFRDAWERERRLDSELAQARIDLDASIRDAGADGRVRDRVLGSLPAPGSIGIGWSRMAAAMLVACVLGGALDLALRDPIADASDSLFVDPLLPLDDLALLDTAASDAARR